MRRLGLRMRRGGAGKFFVWGGVLRAMFWG